MIEILGNINYFYISRDQGNVQQNFWEQGNLMKVNFREHLNLFLGNKGKTPIFSREQGNMYSVLCKIFPAVLFQTINSSTSNERTKKKIKKSEGHSKNSKALKISLQMRQFTF